MVSKRNCRQIAALLAAMFLLVFFFAVAALHSEGSDLTDLSASSPSSKEASFNLFDSLGLGSGFGSIAAPAEPMMSVMKNETAKAELGRSAWRLLHTMAGKYPHKPTRAQKKAMNDFVYLFAQLYPCGDCARHFKVILENHPPDVSSKTAIADWACRVHNIVNKRKEKEQFDCSRILEFYDCGCGPEEEA
ncbi:ERV/ALR sulfhydryl oxidase domain-containing protein [Chytriomyces sp. MP71]|nr:ERV/ALR sulfhydryl oxidase domain-containing protein [Chytriomyces sp. MP71]